MAFSSLVQSFAIIGAAGVLRSIGQLEFLRSILLKIPLDPIYSSAALETVANIRVAAVAIIAPLGDVLHLALPLLFVGSTEMNGQLAQPLIWQGSSVLARGLAIFAGDLAVLVLGIALCRAYSPFGVVWRRVRKSWVPPVMATAGLLAQIIVMIRLFSNPPSLADVEALGLSFAVGVLFPSITGRSMAFSDLQHYVPVNVLAAIMALVVIFAAYALAWVLNLGLRHSCQWFSRRLDIGGRLDHWSNMRMRRLTPAVAGLVVAGILFGFLPTQLEPAPAIEETVSVLTVSEPATVPDPKLDHLSSVPVAKSDAQPSLVTVSGENFNFRYSVNGRPQVIRGMGYNPRYVALDRQERQARYDRDFALMRRAGVNTVFGWTSAEFDEVLLDKAQENGLGVSMPYELSPAHEYSDPKVQAKLKEDVVKWVGRHKRHPSLRMWSIGNEVLHKVVFPSWLPLKKNSDWALTQATAFGNFYVQLLEAVRTADPDHPVILRDAEDAYLQWIRDAVRVRPPPPNSFIYGVNIYTNRIKDVVTSWPKRGLNTPLLVSEFAPAGLRPQDRAAGYRRMWETIRSSPEWTIGGVPYVWFTIGPEEVDRAFGLVDPDGRPVDGALDGIAGFYLNEPPDAKPHSF